MLKKGGNRRFLEFVQLFKLNKDQKTQSTKYITKAADFYRTLLHKSMQENSTFEVDDSLFKQITVAQGAQVMES